MKSAQADNSIDSLRFQVETLLERERQYSHIFNQMLSGYALHEIVYDSDNRPCDYRFLEINPAFEKMTGLSAGKIIGKTILEIMPETEPYWIDIYGVVAQTRKPIQFQHYSRSLKKHFEVMAFSPQKGRFATIFNDITDKKKLEAQFIQSQKMEAIGRLTSGVSHDFNNLLTSIIGNSELLMMECADHPSVVQVLEEILHAGQSAASLVRQLLAFSRKQVFELKILDLNHEIKELKKMIIRLMGENIKVSTFFSKELDKIKADPIQIQQIIINLAVNARDAMPDGGRFTIETSNVFLDDLYAKTHDVHLIPGKYVMMSITDTGIGMDQELQNKIFEPFFSTKEKGKGTGLGLSTVYGIVKQSEGYIWVYSEVGRGTTFKIYFPAEENVSVTNSQEQVVEKIIRGTETVLLVEDEQYVRKLLSKVLRQYGYRVLEAENGEDALALFENNRASIQLVVTDMIMPGMSGIALADRLRSLNPSLKVLYMSGYSDKTFFDLEALGSNMNFIQKPISPREFASKVQALISLEV